MGILKMVLTSLIVKIFLIFSGSFIFFSLVSVITKLSHENARFSMTLLGRRGERASLINGGWIRFLPLVKVIFEKT